MADLVMCEFGDHETGGRLLTTRDGRSICVACARLSGARLARGDRRRLRATGPAQFREARHA